MAYIYMNYIKVLNENDRTLEKKTRSSLKTEQNQTRSANT